MKYLSVILLTVIFGWGEKIQVISTTSQEWVGGLQESGYGTDYNLIVKVKAGSDQLKFEDLWVGDQHMKIRTLPDPARQQVKDFKKGSRISLRAGVTIKPDPDGQIKPLAVDGTKKPFNFKGEGLLAYTYKGRTKYLEIAEFTKLEKIIYP